jgi:hypothetical protein
MTSIARRTKRRQLEQFKDFRPYVDPVGDAALTELKAFLGTRTLDPFTVVSGHGYHTAYRVSAAALSRLCDMKNAKRRRDRVHAFRTVGNHKFEYHVYYCGK